MKITQIECPSCGANLYLEEDRATCFCSYCGKELSVGDRSVVIIHDAAKVKVAEVKQKELEIEQENLHKQWKLTKYKWIVCGVSVLLLILINLITAFFKIDIDENYSIGMIEMILMGVVIGCVCLWAPNENDKK